MLKITSDGRKLGFDPRLIDLSFEDNPDTKLNRCVGNVVRIHAETAEDRLTQIIFCDLGVPHKAAEAAVEGEDADDAKDKKSIAEVESLEEECDFCVYEFAKLKQYTEESGLRSMSEYIYNSILATPIIELTDEELAPDMARFKVIADRINSIAIQVNQTGNVYPEDMRNTSGS